MEVIELDTEIIQRLGEVLTALQGVGHVKVRTLSFDISPKYGWQPRHRVRVTGERSRYGTSVHVTKIERID